MLRNLQKLLALLVVEFSNVTGHSVLLYLSSRLLENKKRTIPLNIVSRNKILSDEFSKRYARLLH